MQRSLFQEVLSAGAGHSSCSGHHSAPQRVEEFGSLCLFILLTFRWWLGQMLHWLGEFPVWSLDSKAMLPEIILVILSPIRSFICVEGTSDAFLQSSALWSRCAWLGLVDTKGCHHSSPPPLPSLSSAAPSVTLNRSTHFIVKIKIYSICNKNIESAHLRTSSHLKTAEHISNKKKNLWYKWNIPTTRKIKEGDGTTLFSASNASKRSQRFQGAPALIKVSIKVWGWPGAKVTVSDRVFCTYFLYWEQVLQNKKEGRKERRKKRHL